MKRVLAVILATAIIPAFADAIDRSMDNPPPEIRGQVGGGGGEAGPQLEFPYTSAVPHSMLSSPALHGSMQSINSQLGITGGQAAFGVGTAVNRAAPQATSVVPTTTIINAVTPPAR
jgi:hypothetical protein